VKWSVKRLVAELRIRRELERLDLMRLERERARSG